MSEDVLDIAQYRSIDSRPIQGLGIELLDRERTAEYIKRAVERGRYNGPTEVEAYWRECRCVALDGDILRPTLTGIICFGHNPQQIFPSAVVSLMHYPQSYVHSGEVLHRERVDGSIFTQLTRVNDYLISHMRRGMALIPGNLERVDLPQFPPPALREGIVNALVHRDYTNSGATVDVWLFSTHLQITNPGGLVAGVTIDLLPSVHQSRNPAIAGILRQAGLSEEAGQGVKTILREYEMAGLQKPVFEDLKSFFKVTFPGQAPEYYAIGPFATLPQRERLILTLIRKHGQLSTNEIQALLDGQGDPIGNRQVMRHLSDLVDLQLVRRYRHGRQTIYALTESAPQQMDLFAVSASANTVDT
jgi:ATP-dependent DNA helicase RecG